MKLRLSAAVAAVVSGLLVSAANGAALITVDDFTVADNTAVITLGSNATTVTRTDSEIDPAHTIGGSRVVILERATGTIYKGTIRPQTGIGPNEQDVSVFSVAAPSDFQPKATLIYGTTEINGLNLKDSQFNFDLLTFDAPGGGDLSLVITITGTNAAVETLTIPAVAIGPNAISQASFSEAVLVSIDTISFAFHGPRGADFSITALSVGIPEPTAVMGLLPAAGLLARRRR